MFMGLMFFSSPTRDVGACMFIAEGMRAQAVTSQPDLLSNRYGLAR